MYKERSSTQCAHEHLAAYSKRAYKNICEDSYFVHQAEIDSKFYSLQIKYTQQVLSNKFGNLYCMFAIRHLTSKQVSSVELILVQGTVQTYLMKVNLERDTNIFQYHISFLYIVYVIFNIHKGAMFFVTNICITLIL